MVNALSLVNKVAAPNASARATESPARLPVGQRNSAASARNIAERLCQSIQQSPIRSAHENIRLTISLGVAVATADTTNFVSLLDDADHAMYAAKRAGRNRVTVAEPGMKPVERRALSARV